MKKTLSLEQPSERAIIVDLLLKIERFSIFFSLRPDSGYSSAPSVLWCLIDVNIIVVCSPFARPIGVIIPNSHMLEMKALIAKSACMQVGGENKISDLDKLTIERWRGCHCVHFKNSLSSSDSLELVVEHDLVTIFIKFHII